MRIFLVLLTFIVFHSSAFALCGYKFPGCARCDTFSQQGNKVRPTGCQACSGFCQPFLATVETQKEVEANTQSSVKEGVLFSGTGQQKISQYLLDMSRSQLMSIAQANPMAAIALMTFTKDFRAESANLIAGEISFGRIPTLATVVQATQGADEHSIDASQNPLPSGVTYARVKWTSVRSGSNLRMTLTAQSIDEQSVPLAADLYPPLVLVLEGNQTGRIVSWSAL